LREPYGSNVVNTPLQNVVRPVAQEQSQSSYGGYGNNVVNTPSDYFF
jgi:hypothetical protein